MSKVASPNIVINFLEKWLYLPASRFLGWLNEAVNFVTNQDFLFVLKTVFLGISLILFVAILYLMKETGYIDEVILDDVRSFALPSRKTKKKVTKEWFRLERLMKSKDKNQLKLAIIEADKILDNILKEIGYEGDSLMERIEKLDPSLVPSVSDLKRAHRFRNKIVHESGFDFSINEAETILSIYEQAFRKLGLI